MSTMKRWLALLALAGAFAFFAQFASAQSTADQVTPGYLTNTGCGGSIVVCWRPYSSTNPVPVGSAQDVISTATIASGASLSGAIDLGTARLAGIYMPSSWTTANLTYQASTDGTNWFELYDNAGNEYTTTVAAGEAVIVPVSDTIGIRYIKIRSGTSGTPVSQGADRVLTLVAIP